MESSKGADLFSLLKDAELKARLSLYYLQNEDNDKVRSSKNKVSPASPEELDISELYKSLKIYCGSLETQIKSRQSEISTILKQNKELERVNEAMLEEIDILNGKMEAYPKTIEANHMEMRKLKAKISHYEEKLKQMERQAQQNEQQVQRSFSLQQDLAQANEFISRLKNHIKEGKDGLLPPNTASSTYKASSVADVPNDTKSTNTEPFDNLISARRDVGNRNYSSVTEQDAKGETVVMKCKSTLAQVKDNLNSIRDSDEFELIREDFEGVMSDMRLLTTRINVSPVESGGGERQHDPTKKFHAIPSIPPKFLLKRERVEVIGWLVMKGGEEDVSVFTSTTDTTSIIVKHTTITNSTLDHVFPLDTPYEQVISRTVLRTCHALSQQRSALVMLLGVSALLLHGHTQNTSPAAGTTSPGLIHNLIKKLLSIKAPSEELNVSVGGFVKNKMCDCLASLDNTSNSGVTSINVTTLQQGADLFNKAKISAECDCVLYQFVMRSDNISRSIGILECRKYGLDTAGMILNYRNTAAVTKPARASLLSETVYAYCDKGATISVFLNIDPTIGACKEAENMLTFSSLATGNEQTIQRKKKGKFPFSR